MITLRRHLTYALVTGALAAATLAGCGQQPMLYGPSMAQSSFNALHHSRSNPAPSSGGSGLNLVTIQCTVTAILPDDNSGLPHQKFVVNETSPTVDNNVEVDNDTHYGSAVPGLQVGEALVIRGVMYHDPAHDGIHWTHHKDTLGDAGYIQTPDGHKYQ